MSKKIAADEKQRIINEYLNGKSVTELQTSFRVPKSTLYKWINERKSSTGKSEELTMCFVMPLTFQEEHFTTL